jgi:lipopolysaccharide transport protein LptA/LPS export ABC transporter protein LptC
MDRRTATVYVASAFIVAIVLLSGYFFAKKPERSASTAPEEAKKVVVFKDVKYSGERKGVVDWEIRAKLVRKFIDRTVVELEGIEGEYKPNANTTVSFKGVKGKMDTDRETGTVQDVEVFYKGDYQMKSSTMDFDFKKSTASTQAPVNLKGKKFELMGVGLHADTKDQVITVEKDVRGTVKDAKGGCRFTSDRFTYMLKDNTYVFEGRVAVKSDRMDMVSDKVYVYSNGDDIDRIEAHGRVSILSKGTIAKSERAVYYFKDEKVVLKEEPKITRDNVEMRGEAITYNLATDKFRVEKPKMRLEQRQ